MSDHLLSKLRATSPKHLTNILQTPRLVPRQVWGTWIGITERDGQALKRLQPLYNLLGDGADGKGLGWLTSKEWEPYFRTLKQKDGAGVYASRFPGAMRAGCQETVWTLTAASPVPSLNLP